MLTLSKRSKARTTKTKLEIPQDLWLEHLVAMYQTPFNQQFNQAYAYEAYLKSLRDMQNNTGALYYDQYAGDNSMYNYGYNQQAYNYNTYN